MHASPHLDALIETSDLIEMRYLKDKSICIKRNKIKRATMINHFLSLSGDHSLSLFQKKRNEEKKNI